MADETSVSTKDVEHLARLKSEIADKAMEVLRISKDLPEGYEAANSRHDTLIEVRFTTKEKLDWPKAPVALDSWGGFCVNGLCYIKKDPPGICIVFRV